MIYWGDVHRELAKYCPHDIGTVKDMVKYLHKEKWFSMQVIANLTKGRCGRTALFLMLKD